MGPCDHLIETAIEAAVPRDGPRLVAAALRRAAAEPSLHVAHCPETGLVVLGAAGEAELGREIDRLRSVDGIPLHVGAPRVALRETLTRRVAHDHRQGTRPNGTGPFARVGIVVEPNGDRAGNLFTSLIAAGAVPDEDLAGVARGIAAVMGAGVLAGHPLAGVRVTLVDITSRGADASALACEGAARAALREALRRGGPVLLEPVMRVEVVTPRTHAGACIADLKRRGGHVRGWDARGDGAAIDATVPLAGLIGYADGLRALSDGRASFTTLFDRYARHAAPSGPDGRGPPPAAMAAARRAA